MNLICFNLHFIFNALLSTKNLSCDKGILRIPMNNIEE